MATTRQILTTAAAEIGYSRWTDSQQGSKYGRWFAQHTGQAWYGGNGVPYCAMFVSWVFAQHGALNAIPGGAFAYCQTCINTGRAQGRAVSMANAKPGDLIFFKWNGTGTGDADHVGIIEQVAANYFVTIEGNTSTGAAGSQDNGGVVARRTRAKDSTVLAIIRPTYTATDKQVEQIIQTIGTTPKEETMLYTCQYAPSANTKTYLTFDPVSGWCNEFGQGTGNGNMPTSYLKMWATMCGNDGKWATITAKHAEAIKAACQAVRQGK